MPEDLTIFEDYAGRRWRCQLTAGFWLWLHQADHAQLNMAGVLYAAHYSQIKTYGITPQQAALVFASPQALTAFAAAVREWMDV